jgi:uncharacterized protein (DUF1684 family)
MKNYLLYLLLAASPLLSRAQTYKDSMESYIRNYVEKHEVVKGDDKKHLDFFQADPAFRVKARLEKKENTPWIPFSTSGRMKKNFRVYAVLHFVIHDTALQLNLYQSQDLMLSDAYRDYLFLPFTDATTGTETYDAGRYIDLKFEDIRNNEVILDFNKAYNPYCAYVSGIYNCPIPPRENRMPVRILAGERKYKKE